MNDLKHHGKVVEHSVRQRGISLTTLAANLKINRRTLYNWFKSPVLEKKVIHRIGITIHHDFSVEFPELFEPEIFTLRKFRRENTSELSTRVNWKNRYIKLLEEYNLLLVDMQPRP